MADTMLQSAHGESVPPTALPTMSTLNGWRGGANASIRQLYEVDRPYLEHYIGSLPTERFDTALSGLVEDGAAQQVEHIVIDAKRCAELLNPDVE